MQSVIKVSDAAAIALHAVIYLKKKSGSLITTKEIAERLELSGHHLAKVLQKLVKSNVVESVKGPKGGFKLKDNNQLSFLEIYEAIDGKIGDKCCIFGRQSCPNGKCIMDNMLSNTNKEFKKFLASKKIADF